VAIVFHARSGRNQSTHDHVLFQPAQVIDATGDRGFSQHARSLLERCRRDERIGRERSLRDSQQQRLGLRNFAAFLSHALVLVLEADAIHLFLEQELRVTYFLDLHPAQHLTNDHFDVLVVDVHTLQAIDLLDFVHEVFLQTAHAQYTKDIVRVEWSIHQRLAGTNAIAILHVDMRAARDVILALFAVVASDDQFAFALRYWTKRNGAIDFRHDRGLRRTPCFEQLDDARQTTRNVFRLGRFARDLRDDVTRLNFLAVAHHQVGAHRHLISLQHLVSATANFQTRLFLFVGRVFHDHARLTGHFVHFFIERHAFLQVLELNVSSNFGKDSERERVPRRQQLVLRDAAAILDEDVRTVNDLVTRRFTASIVDDDQRAVAVHRDAF